jgi:hypothetical protein
MLDVKNPHRQPRDPLEALGLLLSDLLDVVPLVRDELGEIEENLPEEVGKFHRLHQAVSENGV